MAKNLVCYNKDCHKTLTEANAITLRIIRYGIKGNRVGRKPGETRFSFKICSDCADLALIHFATTKKKTG